jgi:hypothetical protein
MSTRDFSTQGALDFVDEKYAEIGDLDMGYAMLLDIYERAHALIYEMTDEECAMYHDIQAFQFVSVVLNKVLELIDEYHTSRR